MITLGKPVQMDGGFVHSSERRSKTDGGCEKSLDVGVMPFECELAGCDIPAGASSLLSDCSKIGNRAGGDIQRFSRLIIHKRSDLSLRKNRRSKIHHTMGRPPAK
jgi:hypothetical protein